MPLEVPWYSCALAKGGKILNFSWAKGVRMLHNGCSTAENINRICNVECNAKLLLLMPI